MVDKEMVGILLLAGLFWILENFVAFAVIVSLLVIIWQLARVILILRTLAWNTGKTADYLLEEKQSREDRK